MEMSKSIIELEIIVNTDHNNYGISRLIESPKKLSSVRFITNSNNIYDESFCRILGNSLTKHKNNIQHLKISKQPITQNLSKFTNLKSLELYDVKCNSLENTCLSFLQIIAFKWVQVDYVINLIGNSGGSLTEISVDSKDHNDINNKRVIQAIYKNCPNLKYLNLPLNNNNFLELEKLLVNCQYLNGLCIIKTCDID
jgi:hypothetical protein